MTNDRFILEFIAKMITYAFCLISVGMLREDRNSRLVDKFFEGSVSLFYFQRCMLVLHCRPFCCTLDTNAWKRGYEFLLRTSTQNHVCFESLYSKLSLFTKTREHRHFKLISEKFVFINKIYDELPYALYGTVNACV